MCYTVCEMAKQVIKLNRNWRLGGEFAGGGFGSIHAAEADNGEPAVIKLIPKMPGGDRELLFVDLTSVPNIIPVLDSGEWGDFWVLVMPRAEKSLRQHLEENGGPLSASEATTVLTDLLAALIALKDRVVHRDIKPENILIYEGHWCLGDFGIARYAEATTATETWKHAKTWAYAAPEQWRGERATTATDIYALGVVAYEMVSGSRPFEGPEEHDFRRQHLEEEPPPLTNCPPALAALLLECLFKAPQARPTPENLLARLKGSAQASSPAAQRLQQLNQAVVEEKAAAEASASGAQSEGERRGQLFQAAEQTVEQIRDALWAEIAQAAPHSASAGGSSWPLELSGAKLSFSSLKAAPPSALRYYDYAPPFDVIAYCEIALRIPENRWQYDGRSHSLWFCDAQEEGVYRWYETAFMINPLIPRRGRMNPFALDPGEDAAVAFSPVVGEVQLAWPMTPIDQGEEQEFIQRWMEWFADAAEGKLEHPRHMPERDPRGSSRPPQRER